MLIWCVHRNWQLLPQLWGGNDRLVAPAGRMHGDHEYHQEAESSLGAWLAQQQTETDTAKQLQEDEVGDAKDTRPLHTTLCKHSKKPQAHPQFKTIWKCGLDLHSSLDGMGFITQILFIAGLSASTSARAMHKNSCFSTCSSGTETNPIKWIKNALFKKNLKYDRKNRHFRHQAFKPHKAPNTTVLPSNFSSTGKKNPLYCQSCAGDNIAFTQICPKQSPGFTNKSAEHPSGISILHFHRQANDNLEERPTSSNRVQEEETSDIALKYPLGD